MNPHTDILDVLLFFAAPAVLALGLLVRGRARQLVAYTGTALLATLLCDTATQLPFPQAFPVGVPVSVPDVTAGLWWVGIMVFASVLVAPRAVAWTLACLLVAPALSIVVFSTNAIAACNLYVHHDGIAREALARSGEQVSTLGLVAAVVFAAAGDRRDRVLGILRGVVAGGLAAGAFAWARGGLANVLVIISLGLPLVTLLPIPRVELGTWIALRVGWGRVAVVAGAALAFALALGVAAHLGVFGGQHASSGWIAVAGHGVLPMTAVYFLLPLFLAALATHGRPVLLPLIPAFIQVRPAWVLLGLAASAGTVGALLVQGESGLSVLVIAAAFAWWIAATGRLRPALLGAGILGSVAALAIVVAYQSPMALAALSNILDRFSWSVLGADDGRTEQVTRAWAAFRDAGWWGTGLRDPGGPLNVPAWTNDFLTMSAARFLGICGAVGLVAAAILPACAALGSAVDEPFATDADRARPAALFTVPWAVLWGGSVVWVGAGALRLLPLSGLAMGLASPALNHLFWTLPAVAWMAARARARAESSAVPVEGLRFAMQVASVGLFAVALGAIERGWARLADRDDAWVLPFSLSTTTRVAAEGDHLTVGEGDDPVRVALGGGFRVGRVTMQAVAGPGVSVVGFHVDAQDLDRGFNLGLAGRHAPLHMDGLGERIALSNDVWLEDAVETHWRELTLRRSGAQVLAVAPFDDSAITVLGQDGAACSARSAGDHCVITDSARIAIRDTYSFVVHIDGLDLDVEWLDGAPAPHLVSRALWVGDRTLAPRVASDQVTVGEARAELGLLGLTGALVVKDGQLQVSAEPQIPANPRGSEAAIVAAAQLAYKQWFTPRQKCPGGWAWAAGRDPLAGGDCVAGPQNDASYVARLRLNGSRVLDVRAPRTKVLDPLSHAEARATRGMVRDRYGTPLYSWVDGQGWMPVEPWIQWVGPRTVEDVPIRAGHPELGTRTVTGYSGLQRVFHSLLSGRYADDGPWVELWRRLRMEPRPAGADITTTLSLPLMRIAAKAAEDEARLLAEKAIAQGARRQAAEHRDCLAYDASLVMTAPDGAILAAVTAVAVIDPTTQAIQIVWETGDNRVECLPRFDGPLRALSAPVMPGSTQKVWVYAEAAQVAQEGDPWIRFAPNDGGDDIFALDAGDPDNGDGTHLLDRGTLERVYGHEVPDCHDHGTVSGTDPIRFVDAFARSANVPACLLASALNLDHDRIGPVIRSLQLDGPLDLLPPLTDPVLERSRLPLWLPFASGGRVDVLADGKVSLKEATKMPLGKGISPTVLGLTAADRAIGNGGVYTPPYLVSGVRLADGIEVGTTPRAGVRVWDEASASWVLRAMEGTVQVEGATAYKAMKGLPDTQRLAIGLKTGTADTFTEVNGRQVSLPSPKAAVALYPAGSASPVSMAAWCRHAEGLDDYAAMRMIRQVIASGALDVTVAQR